MFYFPCMWGSSRNGARVLGLLFVGTGLATSCGKATEASGPAGESAGSESVGGAGASGATDATVPPEGGNAGEAPDAAGAGGQADESIPLDRIAQPSLEAECEKLERCGLAIQFEQAPGGCVGAQLADWQAAFDGVKDEIARGTVVYDPTAARACIEARRNARCDSLGFPRACEALIDGTRRAGEACQSGVECEQDLQCQGCPGKCTPLRKLGQACSDEAPCDVTLECVEGQCAARPLEGDACGSVISRYCLGSEHCSGETDDSPGVCQPQRVVGRGEDCGSGLGVFCGLDSACVQQKQADESVREVCVERSRSGGTCWHGIQDTCPEGEYCPLTIEDQLRGLAAKCRPLAQPGERCPASNGCAPGGRCLFGNLCVAPRATGQPCYSPDECSSYICSNGTCVDSVCGTVDYPPPVLHDPPPPPERCPTMIAGGDLLQGFDSSDSIADWRTQSEGTATSSLDWSTTERYSCSGALHLHAAFSAMQGEFVGTTPLPLSDWSQRTRLHFWVRLQAASAAEVGERLAVHTFVSARDADLSHGGWSFASADATSLRDFAWHEFVLDLRDLSNLERVDGYGVRIGLDAAAEGASNVVPEVDLYVDDIWLE
ncbi:MAG TPA: Dickkopf N-terminal cysteine-rich domain-containing protein [Polyangiaceae bacterium]|nr:Dickkopf N-terminal cysteine-rich domain-containing protein [Polyangiaceae bacterium]